MKAEKKNSTVGVISISLRWPPLQQRGPNMLLQTSISLVYARIKTDDIMSLLP